MGNVPGIVCQARVLTLSGNHTSTCSAGERWLRNCGALTASACYQPTFTPQRLPSVDRVPESPMTAPCPTFGFHVLLEFAPRISASERATFETAWFAFVRQLGLHAEGRNNGVQYVVTGDASQAIDGDRTLVHRWLAERPEVLDMHVGELVDLEQVG